MIFILYGAFWAGNLKIFMFKAKSTKTPALKNKIVQKGARVLVEIEGEIDELEIVDGSKANPLLGRVAFDSVIGKALLNHKVGDTVVISSAVKIIYRIKGIESIISAENPAI